jgi:hypothetical protein
MPDRAASFASTTMSRTAYLMSDVLAAGLILSLEFIVVSQEKGLPQKLLDLQLQDWPVTLLYW